MLSLFTIVNVYDNWHIYITVIYYIYILQDPLLRGALTNFKLESLAFLKLEERGKIMLKLRGSKCLNCFFLNFV